MPISFVTNMQMYDANNGCIYHKSENSECKTESNSNGKDSIGKNNLQQSHA